MWQSRIFKTKDIMFEQLVFLLKDDWPRLWEVAIALENLALYNPNVVCSNWLIVEVAKRGICSWIKVVQPESVWSGISIAGVRTFAFLSPLICLGLPICFSTKWWNSTKSISSFSSCTLLSPVAFSNSVAMVLSTTSVIPSKIMVQLLVLSFSEDPEPESALWPRRTDLTRKWTHSYENAKFFHPKTHAKGMCGNKDRRRIA